MKKSTKETSVAIGKQKSRPTQTSKAAFPVVPMAETAFSVGYSHAGQPPIYDDWYSLALKANEYFVKCCGDGTRVTVTGITLHLGFESRQSFYDYEKRPEFSYTIKRIRLACENSYENGTTAMDIFALKNMGWRDRQEVEHSGELKNAYEITVKFE